MHMTARVANASFLLRLLMPKDLKREFRINIDHSRAVCVGAFFPAFPNLSIRKDISRPVE